MRGVQQPRVSPHSVRLALGYELPGLSARQRDEKRIFPERDKVHSPMASDFGSGALGGDEGCCAL